MFRGAGVLSQSAGDAGVAILVFAENLHVKFLDCNSWIFRILRVDRGYWTRFVDLEGDG